jgi:hypothetical protein
VVAVAVENPNRQAPGQAVFFDTEGAFLSAVTVGALPDMITFTPDGQKVLVANEGEPSPDYSVDPEGSISIIDMFMGAAALTEADVTTVGFTDFDQGGPRHDELDPRIRIFGPGATVAQDLEPEYKAVSDDSSTAWVTLQENNAVAVIDIESATVAALVALGFKNHSFPENALDPSDRDGGINIAPWPVLGIYQPDSIATFSAGGTTYLVTANEGDSREYSGFNEEARVADVTLDPTIFPDAATLQLPANLGRLKMTRTLGSEAGDGVYQEIYAFGARSFSIWTASGELVYDSGSELELRTTELVPQFFNSNGTVDTFDTRSDDKRPEPEAVVVGEVDGRPYAFVGLERTGGVLIYDVSDPTAPASAGYADNLRVDPQLGTLRDLAPEGLAFIQAEESPTGRPLLVTANEVSGTTSLYEIGSAPTSISLSEVAATSPERWWPLALGAALLALSVTSLARGRD